MIVKDVHIMMGLPGSGKTTYILEHKTKEDYIISMDDYWYENSTIEDKLRYLGKCSAQHNAYRGTPVVWIDGLILTFANLTYVIDIYMKAFHKENYMALNEPTLVNFHIHQYEDNRENCKNNDIKRSYESEERWMTSQITIENADYEMLTKENLDKLYSKCLIENSVRVPDNIEYHIDYEKLPVKKCGNWELRYKQVGRYNDNPNILKSETWSLGGSWGDYRGNMGSISADEQPEFTELDDILLETCPNLPILMYKKIYRDFVEIKEDSEYDYYGGCEHIAHYEADMKGIYDYLRENNMIDE